MTFYSIHLKSHWTYGTIDQGNFNLFFFSYLKHINLLWETKLSIFSDRKPQNSHLHLVIDQEFFYFLKLYPEAQKNLDFKNLTSDDLITIKIALLLYMTFYSINKSLIELMELSTKKTPIYFSLYEAPKRRNTWQSQKNLIT